MNNHIEVLKASESGVFTNYIFKAIPLAFDESMSYYETLCALKYYLQNTIIPTLNNNADAIIELQNNVDEFETNVNNTVEELESFINNYFNNLDVQQEINNKLDDMVTDGTLQNLIDTYLNSIALFGYDNVASMKASTNLINGSYAQTMGYYSINDGGKALYKIRTKTNEDTTDEMLLIEMSDENLVAELIYKDSLNVKQMGAYGDGTHDDSSIIQKAIDSVNHIYLPKGTYYIGTGLTMTQNKYINGDGKFLTIIKYGGTSSAIEVEYTAFGNAEISNLSINKNGGYDENDTTTRGINFVYNSENSRSVTHFHIVNVDIRYFRIGIKSTTSNTILNSTMENSSLSYNYYHMDTYGGYNNYVKNCVFSNSYGSIIQHQAGEHNYIQCSFENNPHNIHLKASGGSYSFINCFFEQTSQVSSFIETYDIGLQDISMINIDNCHFYGGTTQVYLSYVEHVIIKGCTMSNPSSKCVGYSTSNQHIKSLTLINNKYGVDPVLTPTFVNLVGYDSGWTDIDTTNATHGTFHDFQMRRIDKQIFVRGTITGLTADDSGQTMGITIPENFRPNQNAMFIIPASDNSNDSKYSNYGSIKFANTGYIQFQASPVYNTLNVYRLENITYSA